jgi:heme-degrading monooxygenase HmoA
VITSARFGRVSYVRTIRTAEGEVRTMFSVIFEVRPKADQWETYLAYAKMLRPELEKIDGFVDNIRYRSLTREGWILSLSGWRDEKSLIRWRTHAKHQAIQTKGRTDVFVDYHLRVAEVTKDTRLPEGQRLEEQRLDETQTGQRTAVTLIDTQRAAEWVKSSGPSEVATWLGLVPDAPGLIEWDIWDAVLSPGDILLLLSWRDRSRAEAFESKATLPEGGRLRGVRVVRDYGMFDRREAPRYFPSVETSQQDLR